jgi:hypothetical protein
MPGRAKLGRDTRAHLQKIAVAGTAGACVATHFTAWHTSQLSAWLCTSFTSTTSRCQPYSYRWLHTPPSTPN